jgi:hypothetical protein
MKEYVWQRLWDVLSNSNEARFEHLSPDDCQAIIEILRATKSDLPPYWTAAK